MKTPVTKLSDMSSKPSRHVERAAESANREPLQRLNIDLPKDIHAALKAKSATMQKSMKEVVEQLVADFLK